MNTFLEQNQRRHGNKKQYSHPRLRSFGTVSQLTTSGTGGNFEIESPVGSMHCSANLTRKVNPSCP